MQIACKKFGCQKAVEVCYWSCKFRGKCKDWQNGLAGEPGLAAIQTRLEAAAAKTGRAFDPQTLAAPVRTKRSSHPLNQAADTVDQPATVVVSLPTTSRAPVKAAAAHFPVKKIRKIRTMNNPEESKPVSKPSQTEESKPVSKVSKNAPVRSKPVTNGTVYLLLQKNGKYKELREADLVTQAPLLLQDKTLRLIKGQIMVPTISFTTNEE